MASRHNSPHGHRAVSTEHSLDVGPSTKMQSRGGRPSEVGKSTAWESYTAETMQSSSRDRGALHRYLKFGTLSDHFVTPSSRLQDELQSAASKYDGPADTRSGTTASGSTEIIVGNGGVADKAVKTCWSAADQSEWLDEDRYLPSFEDKQPDWMTQDEEENLPKKLFAPNLKRWQYRSPKTQTQTNIVQPHQRKKRVLKVDKDNANSARSPMSIKSNPQSETQLPNISDSKGLEDGEVLLSDVKSPAKSVKRNSTLYVPPHQRKQAGEESSTDVQRAAPHERRRTLVNQLQLTVEVEKASPLHGRRDSSNAHETQANDEIAQGKSCTTEPSTPLPQRVIELKGNSNSNSNARAPKTNDPEITTPTSKDRPGLGAAFDIQAVLQNMSEKYSSRYSQPSGDKESPVISTPSTKGTIEVVPGPSSPSIPISPISRTTALKEKETLTAPAPKPRPEPAISPDWYERRMFYDPAERKSVSRRFAEEQAQHLSTEQETVDTSAADFQAGLPILPEGEEDVIVEISRDKQAPRAPEPATIHHPPPKSKTSNQRIRERMNTIAENPMLGMLANPIEELRALSKEEKARIRKLQKEHVRERVDPPKADIYLRPAQDSDAQQICNIWNWHVENSVAAVSVIPDGPDFWRSEIKQDGVPPLPFIVACLKRGTTTKARPTDLIVGFGRALEVGCHDNAFRFSLELEVYVEHQSLKQGIGRCIFDRVMACVAGPPYQLKNSAPLIGTDDPLHYQGGCFRNALNITVSILYTDDDPTYEWKKDFLVTKNEFKQSSHKPNIGYKLGKHVHMDEFYFETYKSISPDEITRSAFQWQ